MECRPQVHCCRCTRHRGRVLQQAVSVHRYCWSWCKTETSVCFSVVLIQSWCELKNKLLLWSWCKPEIKYCVFHWSSSQVHAPDHLFHLLVTQIVNPVWQSVFDPLEHCIFHWSCFIVSGACIRSSLPFVGHSCGQTTAGQVACRTQSVLVL